jgi:hypothetical protein
VKKEARKIGEIQFFDGLALAMELKKQMTSKFRRRLYLSCGSQIVYINTLRSFVDISLSSSI